MAVPTAVWSVADVESFIKEYYDAWGGTDEDRIMSYYADNVVLQIPGTLMEGKEAVRDQFARAFVSAFPGKPSSCEEYDFLTGGGCRCCTSLQILNTCGEVMAKNST